MEGRVGRKLYIIISKTKKLKIILKIILHSENIKKIALVRVLQRMCNKIRRIRD